MRFWEFWFKILTGRRPFFFFMRSDQKHVEFFLIVDSFALSKNWTAAPPLKLYPNHDFFGLRSGVVLAVRMATSVEYKYFRCSEGLQFSVSSIVGGCFDKKPQIFDYYSEFYQNASNISFYSVISLIIMYFQLKSRY